jgi:hypothetical protein
MIARCRKDVVNYSKPVLFKATVYAKFAAGNKAFLLSWLGLLFCQRERGKGLTTRRKEIIILIVCRFSFAGLVRAVSCHDSKVT